MLIFLFPLPAFSQMGTDSVVVAASTRYTSPGIAKTVLLGSNYRKAWAEPVKMPVLHLATSKGGLKPMKETGGKHTHSLVMTSPDGTEWTLRTADKTVAKTIAPVFRNTRIQTYTQDMISASFPYAPLIVSRLADALQIPNTQDELFYVPDDAALDTYAHDFARKVCFLERRYPVRSPADKSYTKLPHDSSKNLHMVVLQKLVLKARLLDILVGDWDRYEQQYHWGSYDSAGTTWVYPVPVDRDQAFYRANGLATAFIDVLAAPYLGGFKARLNKLSKFNRMALEFDKKYLDKLPATEWKETIKEFQQCLTNAVIRDAVNALPPEIKHLNGEKMSAYLKTRRDQLPAAAMEYYYYLHVH